MDHRQSERGVRQENKKTSFCRVIRCGKHGHMEHAAEAAHSSEKNAPQEQWRFFHNRQSVSEMMGRIISNKNPPTYRNSFPAKFPSEVHHSIFQLLNRASQQWTPGVSDGRLTRTAISRFLNKDQSVAIIQGTDRRDKHNVTTKILAHPQPQGAEKVCGAVLLETLTFDTLILQQQSHSTIL